MTSTHVALLAVAFVTSWSLQSAAQMVSKANVSDPQVRAALLALSSKIHAFRIEYQSVPDGVGVAPKSGIHRVVAQRSPGEFFEASAHYCEYYRWQDDPTFQNVTIRDGVLRSYFPFDRRYREWSFEKHSPLPGSYSSEFLFFSLGWWVLRRCLSAAVKCGAGDLDRCRTRAALRATTIPRIP